MHYALRKGSQRLGVEDVAKLCRWTEATARAYMGEMVRPAQALGEPLVVTRAALEHWLVRNCERAVGPTLSRPADST